MRYRSRGLPLTQPDPYNKYKMLYNSKVSWDCWGLGASQLLFTNKCRKNSSFWANKVLKAKEWWRHNQDSLTAAPYFKQDQRRDVMWFHQICQMKHYRLFIDQQAISVFAQKNKQRVCYSEAFSYWLFTKHKLSVLSSVDKAAVMAVMTAIIWNSADRRIYKSCS